MPIVSATYVVDIGLVQEIIAVKVVEVCSKGQKNATCHNPELHSKLKGMFELVLLDWVILIHDEKRNKNDGKDSEVHC